MSRSLPPSWRTVIAAQGSDDPTRTLGARDAVTRHTEPAVAPDTRRWQELGAGAAVPQFEVLALLGHGGMGQVLLARQGGLEREVAVKVLAEERADPRRAAALRAEARLAGGLDHPHVVPIHDAGADWFAMRRVRGETLEELLVTGIALRDVVTILRKVADALVFAHDQGVVHRDLKPANIMVGAFGEVLLMDWGLGLALERTSEGWRAPGLDAAVAAAGTPSYLAPEMARAEVAAIGPASDVYLLGATLYRALCGKPPHAGGSLATVLEAAAENRIPPVAELAPAAPQRLATLAMAAMASEPTQRPDIRALRAGLVAWLRSQADEDQARAAVAEARREAETARAQTDPVAAHPAWSRAAAALDRARDLWSDLPGLAAERTACARERCELALAGGELGLAERVARRSGDAELVASVAAARADQRRAQRRSTLLRSAAALGLVLCLVGGGALLRWYAAAAPREAERRRDAARAQLAALVAIPGDDDAARRERIARAYRALGFDPTAPGVQQALLDQLLASGRAALARGDLATAAEAAAQLAPRFGQRPAVLDLQAELEARRLAPQRADAAEFRRRTDRLEQLVVIARERSGGHDWFERAVDEIAGWDGTRMAPAIAALVGDRDALVARLGREVLARRSDLDDGGALAASLATTGPAADEAADALARRGDLAAAPALVAWLTGSDPWDARRAAAAFGPELRAACLTLAEEAPVDVLLALDAIDAAAQRAGDDPAALARVARAAWWQRDDERWRALGDRLAATAPDSPWSRILRADALLVAGRPRAALAALGPEPEPSVALRAQLALGDEAAAEALCRRLEADGPSEPALALHSLISIELMRGTPVAPAVRAWLPERFDDDREAVRAALRAGALPQAERLGRIHAEQYHGHGGALVDAGEARRRAGDPAAALRLVERALTYHPGFHSHHKAAARCSLELDDHARSLRLARAAVASAENHICFDGLEMVLAAARRAGDDAAVLDAAEAILEHGRYGELATTATRCVLELGRTDLALAWLYRFGDLPLASDGALRAAIDQVLLTLPPLRRSGWPGSTGLDLAAALLREARVHLATDGGDPAVAMALVADARRHLDDSTGPLASAAELLEGVAAGAGSAAIARALDALAAASPARLPWPSRLVLHDRAWLADGAVGPLPRLRYDPAASAHTWPRRPLADWQPDPDERAALIGWLRRHGRSLAPGDGLDLALVARWQEQPEALAEAVAAELAP